MELTYKKADGTTFNCWYRDFNDTLEVLGQGDGVEFGPMIHLQKPIHKDWDNTDCMFLWDGENFNFKDFEALTVDELIQKIKEARAEAKESGNRPWVPEKEAICTFLKYSDKIGILAKVECFSTVIPFMGIGIKGTGSSIAKALMVPFEGRYKKTEWTYKIDLKAYDEDKYGEYIGQAHPYFSDFWDTILDRPDIYELVNLETYLSQQDPVLFELTSETR